MIDSQRLRLLIEVLIKNGKVRNQQAFSEITELNKSVLSDILTGSRKFSERYVDKICTRLDFVNRDWLISGTGEMLLDTSNNKDEKDNIIALQKKLIEKHEIIDDLKTEIENLKREIETYKKAQVNVANAPTANVG